MVVLRDCEVDPTAGLRDPCVSGRLAAVPRDRGGLSQIFESGIRESVWPEDLVRRA